MNRELINKAKECSIVEYLLSRGYKYIPSKSKGRYFRYYSMLHNEKVPSFFVNKSDTAWIDFGLSDEWHDIIELVRAIEQVSFSKAIEILIEKKLPTRKIESKDYYREPGIEIVDTFDIRNPRLINYLRGRRIEIDLAKVYCREALIRFRYGNNPEKIHSYIAFKNDKGGYELRNHYNLDISKISSSPKYFTRIAGVEDKYNLFEGFIDYLSLLSKYQTERFKNTTVVLNSLVNITYLYETLKKNTENNIFLNNDEAADKYVYKGDKKLKIKSFKEQGIDYIDRRLMFDMYNDINDYINGKILI